MWKMRQNHDAAPDQSITIAKGFVFYIILSELLECQGWDNASGKCY